MDATIGTLVLMIRQTPDSSMTRRSPVSKTRDAVLAAAGAVALGFIMFHYARRGLGSPGGTVAALGALAAVGGGAVLLTLRLWAANRAMARALDLQTADLLQANAKLREEIDERRQAELALMRYKSHLEIQVKAGNCELQKEVADHRQARNALSEYHLALEASDEMVTVLDRRYIFTMVNDAYLKRRHTERETIIGTSIVDAIGEDAFHAIKPHLDACFQGETVEYEMVQENESTGKRHLLIRYYPARSSSGRVNRVVSVIKDITAVKRAEEDRERLFSLSIDPICVVDFNGYFKDLNSAWSRVLGWSKEELLSIPWFSFVHPDDAAATENVGRTLAQGQPVKDFRHRYIGQDGRTCWLEWNAIPDTAEGLIYAVARDVTDQIKSREKIKLNEERLQSLLKLSQMTGVSDEKIRAFALEEIVRLTRSKAGYLHFVNEETQMLELVAWSKDARKACRVDKTLHYPLDKAGVWADSVRLRRPVIHNDFSKVPGKKGMPEGHFPIHRHMSVPVMDNGRIVAVAGVGNKEAAYDESDVRQLTLFMTSMWSIIKQKRAQQILKKYSMEDGLTGLANRRRFDAALEHEWQRALRAHQPMALIMMDIDFFKPFNDLYGHQAGDECLKKVAACLRKNVRRAGDLVARYGGEEFVVILPNTDLTGGREVAEAMHRTVRDMRLRHRGAPGRDVLTISAGVASGIPRRGRTSAALLQKADEALYRAKRAGRDCVKLDEAIDGAHDGLRSSKPPCAVDQQASAWPKSLVGRSNCEAAPCRPS
jgi:diguanylate cyclase (GGDEF)-like protein/PAS domain S-box-containing protein